MIPLTVSQWSRCQRFLIEHANDSYGAWLKTKAGKAYLKKRKLLKSPHHHGFTQPEWMSQMREAMGRDDAERALGILHAVLSGNAAAIH